MLNTCPTKLLGDDPADVDAFGSHGRVAEAIEDLVCSTPGGKAIALRGAWGSGKSTAIKLLSARLRQRRHADQSSPELFVFDAWTHQGDPLRRSFLQELVTFLIDKAWIPAHKWKERLDQLSRRREDSEVVTEPRLTLAGRLTAISALLIAPGAALYAKSASDGHPLGSLGAVLALLLTMAPLLAAILTWIAWRPTWRFWKRMFWTQHRHPYESESLASLFVSKTQETTRTRMIRTPNPTSIEFKEAFFEVLGSALPGTGRRLVLVMDNLDRLPPSDAVAIWSTMRIFFEPDHSQPSWTDQLWLLIPFDPSALNRIWGQPTDGEALAAAYSDKIFQVSFFVPPPVLSDWQSFFMTQMRAALPSHDHTDDFDAVYRLYRIYASRRDFPPTPRQIKLFINGLCAVHGQWHDAIPLASQALYVLNAERIATAPIAIAREDFLDARSGAAMRDLEWREHLAALHFNVAREKALQVLLGSRLERSLAEGDSDSLRELQAVPGFTVLVEQCLEESQQNWIAGEPNAVAMAALALDSLNLGEGKNLALPVLVWLKAAGQAA